MLLIILDVPIVEANNSTFVVVGKLYAIMVKELRHALLVVKEVN